MKHEYRSEQGQVAYLELPEGIYAPSGIDLGGVQFDVVPVIQEPKGLGAVVEAEYVAYSDLARCLFIREHDGDWMDDDGDHFQWNRLKNQKVLSEGYTPEA